MRIRLIASDIDGTLLRSDNTLAQATRSALWVAADRGIQIVLATGRTTATMAELLDELPMVRYVIRSNGGSVWDRSADAVIGEHTIPRALFPAIFDAVCSEDVCWHCFTDGIGYIDETMVPRVKNLFEPGGGRGEEFARSMNHVEDARGFILEHVSRAEKFGVLTENGAARQRIWEKLKGIPGLSISSARSQNLEINMKSATKGNALRELEDFLGISKEEVIAFGDNLNDCSLLKEAGIGVAMGNASSELIPFATHRTYSNDEDGVARFLASQLNIPFSPDANGACRT